MKKFDTPTIRELYPDLNEDELAAAEANLEQYLTVVLRIFEYTESEDGILNTPPNAVEYISSRSQFPPDNSPR